EGFKVMDASGWESPALIAPYDPLGLGWILTRGHDEDTVWIDAVRRSVKDVIPEVAIPDIVDGAASGDGGDPADRFFQDVLADQGLGNDGKRRFINTAGNMAGATGALTTAMKAASGAQDSIAGRISFLGDHFTEAGLLDTGEKGANLWVDAKGMRNRSKGLESTGMRGGLAMNSRALVVGLDGMRPDRQALVGGALSYEEGSNGKAAGDWWPASVKARTLGAHLYGEYNREDRFNVSGILSILQSESSGVAQGAAGRGPVKAKVANLLLAAQARAELRVPLGQGLALVPRAGLSVIHAAGEAFETREAGAAILRSSPESLTALQPSLGLGLRGDVAAGGWRLKGSAALDMAWQAGSLRQRVKVSSGRASDTVANAFAGRYAFKPSLTFEAARGNAAFGLGYAGAIGPKAGDHALKLLFKYRF
ncbi:MAG: autotransporter outer membrane beta-barrel domain-containing protein, partial [Duodenibacillus sp.]|nr:autotransporter outer membrane beta-barrel domain-containing protein [Duodenibacillus sp.]